MPSLCPLLPMGSAHPNSIQIRSHSIHAGGGANGRNRRVNEILSDRRCINRARGGHNLVQHGICINQCSGVASTSGSKLIQCSAVDPRYYFLIFRRNRCWPTPREDEVALVGKEPYAIKVSHIPQNRTGLGAHHTKFGFRSSAISTSVINVSIFCILVLSFHRDVL